MNKYKKWNIPLAVGAHYDGHMVHYAIPENPAYIALGDLPNPGSIEVIELAALEACQKRLDEACELLRKTKAIAQQETSILEDQKTIDEIDTFLSQIKDEGE